MVKEKVDYLSYLLRLWREGEEKTALEEQKAGGQVRNEKALDTDGRAGRTG